MTDHPAILACLRRAHHRAGRRMRRSRRHFPAPLINIAAILGAMREVV